MSNLRSTRNDVLGVLALVIVVTLVVLGILASAWWLLRDLSTWAHSGDGLPATPGSSTVQVAEVVDGDTIEVRFDDRTEKVRLLGIDTPETKDPRTPVQCFGPEASRHTAELLPPGTEVRLEADVERRDRYDRLLAYVYRAADGLFVNLELAAAGYADVLSIPPNLAHAAELSAAVAEARRAPRGLWQACGGPGRPA